MKGQVHAVCSTEREASVNKPLLGDFIVPWLGVPEIWKTAECFISCRNILDFKPFLDFHSISSKSSKAL